MKILICILILFLNLTSSLPGFAADTKLTAETEITSVTSDDIFDCVDDPAGTPVNKKCPASKIQTFINTGINTEAKLEAVSNITNILRETEIDASSELAAIMDDETGTGALVFGTAPTFTTSITMGSAVLSEAELEIIDGGTLTTIELNYVDGVTSAIQTQLNAKEGTLTNEAGLMSALSDVTNFLQTGDALAGDDITDGSIDATELAANSVDSSELVDGSVDLSHMSSASVDSDNIVDDSIKPVDLDFTDTEADEECVTYEATGTAFESQICDQPGKQTEWISAADMRPTVSNGSAVLADVETTAGRPDMNVLDFDDSAEEHAQFLFSFPKSWDEGVITFQPVWTKSATPTGGLDGVVWGLQGLCAADDASIDQAYGTEVVVGLDAIKTVEDVWMAAESGDVTLAAAAVDTVCWLQVSRVVASTTPLDDMDVDARLIGVRIFWTTDAANDD